MTGALYAVVLLQLLLHAVPYVASVGLSVEITWTNGPTESPIPTKMDFAEQDNRYYQIKRDKFEEGLISALSGATDAKLFGTFKSWGVSQVDCTGGWVVGQEEKISVAYPLPPVLDFKPPTSGNGPVLTIELEMFKYLTVKITWANGRANAPADQHIAFKQGLYVSLRPEEISYETSRDKLQKNVIKAMQDARIDAFRDPQAKWLMGNITGTGGWQVREENIQLFDVLIFKPPTTSEGDSQTVITIKVEIYKTLVKLFELSTPNSLSAEVKIVDSSNAEAVITAITSAIESKRAPDESVACCWYTSQVYVGSPQLGGALRVALTFVAKEQLNGLLSSLHQLKVYYDKGKLMPVAFTVKRRNGETVNKQQSVKAIVNPKGNINKLTLAHQVTMRLKEIKFIPPNQLECKLAWQNSETNGGALQWAKAEHRTRGVLESLPAEDLKKDLVVIVGDCVDGSRNVSRELAGRNSGDKILEIDALDALFSPTYRPTTYKGLPAPHDEGSPTEKDPSGSSIYVSATETPDGLDLDELKI